MKRIQVLLLSLFLCVLPGVSFAELSLSELVDVDTSLSIDLGADMQTDIAYGTGPGGNGGPGYGPRPGNGGPGHRPVIRRTSVHRGPAPVVHRTVVRRPIRPVVVVEQPSTVVVANSTAATQVESVPVVEKIGSTFGFGLRGVGLLQGSVTLQGGDSVESRMGGGIGYYFKYRPVRWVSVEFTNDILFAKYDDQDGTLGNMLGGDLTYIRVPVSLGLQIHVFDYGMLDVYGVAAASVSFTTVDDGNRSINREGEYYQFGGQLGAGASLLLGVLELGVDVRYTIDQAPENLGIQGFKTKTDHNKPVHGLIFSINIGLGI